MSAFAVVYLGLGAVLLKYLGDALDGPASWTVAILFGVGTFTYIIAGLVTFARLIRDV